jgi:hypothetical protein
MPITLEGSDGKLGSILTTWGTVNEKELFDKVEESIKREMVKPQKHKYHLSDHTAAEEFEFSAQGVKLLADICKAASQANPELVTATVARKDLIFGLSRMWESLSVDLDWEIMVFRNRDKAESWIRERVKDKFGIKDLTFRAS